MSDTETIIIIALDEVERALLRMFLVDWKNHVDVGDLNETQYANLERTMDRLSKKIGMDE